MLMLPHEYPAPTGAQEFEIFLFLDFKPILKEFLIALRKTFTDKDSFILGIAQVL